MFTNVTNPRAHPLKQTGTILHNHLHQQKEPYSPHAFSFDGRVPTPSFGSIDRARAEK